MRFVDYIFRCFLFQLLGAALHHGKKLYIYRQEKGAFMQSVARGYIQGGKSEGKIEIGKNMLFNFKLDLTIVEKQQVFLEKS